MNTAVQRSTSNRSITNQYVPITKRRKYVSKETIYARPS